MKKKSKNEMDFMVFYLFFMMFIKCFVTIWKHDYTDLTFDFHGHF
jgi:hypothetical protein